MSLRINLNTSALTAQRSLSGTQDQLSKTIERLSSGYRINSAADDPSGLVISEKLRAQSSGLSQAIKNAGDAVNMVKTAEGALGEVSRILISMREMAVHAANAGANDTAAISADQAQINNAIQSLNNIAAETQFGNKKLLDGSAGLTASISGTSVVSGDFSNPIVSFTNNDPISIQVTQSAKKGQIVMADFGTDATVVSQSGTLFVNGLAFDYKSGIDTAQTMQTKINARSADIGVTATLSCGQITLSTTTYGSTAKVSATSSSAYMLGATSATGTGANVQATITSSGTNVSDATWSSGDGLVLKDSRGNQIVMTEAAGTVTTGAPAEQFRVALGTMKFQIGAYSGQTRELNIRSTKADTLGTGAVAGESLATVDVTTSAGATDAITILDEAITQISTLRASLGAAQKNVFESSVTSLSAAQQNIASSESTIRDTDMAAEVVNMTRYQIMQQAGVSMLSQANQTPQTMLKLLQ